MSPGLRQRGSQQVPDTQRRVLYVDGDLTIQEGVNGYGAAFCTRNMPQISVRIRSSALVAGKDLTLKGDGASTTQFRGLVYSGGARRDWR